MSPSGARSLLCMDGHCLGQDGFLGGIRACHVFVFGMLTIRMQLYQAIKLFDFFRYWLLDGRTSRYTIKWLLVDSLYCLCLAFLRIPRLNYSLSVVILQILSLWLLNGFMFGGITVNLGLGGSWGLPTLRFNSEWSISYSINTSN